MAASSADTDTGGSVTISSVAYHAPEGYLICNGGDIPTSGTFQGVNASLLQNLRNFLGGTYGAAGRLPNLLASFAGYSAVPGTIGGSANATLVSHSHGASSSASSSVTDPGHSHTLRIQFDQSGGTGFAKPFPGGNRYTDVYTDEWVQSRGTGISVSTSVSTSIAAAGSSATNANLPPYYALAFIMRTS